MDIPPIFQRTRKPNYKKYFKIVKTLQHRKGPNNLGQKKICPESVLVKAIFKKENKI